MSDATANLLTAFEALPSEERHAFLNEALRLVMPYDSGPLDDEEFASVGDEIMAALDAEEDAPPAR